MLLLINTYKENLKRYTQQAHTPHVFVFMWWLKKKKETRRIKKWRDVRLIEDVMV